MPRPQWTGSACAADMLEINCLMESLGMLCGCPAMKGGNFKPSAATCGEEPGKGQWKGWQEGARRVHGTCAW